MLVTEYFLRTRRKATSHSQPSSARTLETNRLVQIMEQKDSAELLKLLSIKDHAGYTAEAYEAMEVVLRRRGKSSEIPGTKNPDEFGRG